MQNRPHSHLCMAELHKRPMRLKTMSAGFSVQMILQGNFTTHSNQALSLIFINHLWSTRCLRCWVLLDCCFGFVSTRMSRFLQPKCHFECLPDSQVYHFDRLLFTPGTCHSLWILRKSCPQIVCSQRIEGKNGGENHEVRVVNLARGWSIITLQNSSVTLKLKNDRLMIHDPILSFLRFNMKSYLLKSYYKKLGLKTTCRFPQWFWTRVCTTAKAFLSIHGLTQEIDNMEMDEACWGWGVVVFPNTTASWSWKLDWCAALTPANLSHPHYCGWVLLVLV